jgi:hypothetical protein
MANFIFSSPAVKTIMESLPKSSSDSRSRTVGALGELGLGLFDTLRGTLETFDQYLWNDRDITGPMRGAFESAAVKLQEALTSYLQKGPGGTWLPFEVNVKAIDAAVKDVMRATKDIAHVWSYWEDWSRTEGAVKLAEVARVQEECVAHLRAAAIQLEARFRGIRPADTPAQLELFAEIDYVPDPATEIIAEYVWSSDDPAIQAAVNRIAALTNQDIEPELRAQDITNGENITWLPQIDLPAESGEAVVRYEPGL